MTSPYTLSWYDLIAWAPLALLRPTRLDGLMVLRGAALSVAYVTGRTVGFSDLMVDGVAFVVRDVICSAIQWYVLVAIVHWFWTTSRQWPTVAFVREGIAHLGRDGAADATAHPAPVVRNWRRPTN